MNKEEVLRHYFGHDSFRPGQGELIDAVMSGRDALGIMPTGAGKSMCYQVPAMMLPGITLVISPLISLMKDQVATLKMAGIPAAYLNSSLTPGQMELAMSRASQGAYKLIYVAPERLEAPSFRRFAQYAEISLVAVDEAHCVSQWGQDFRPNYLHIADFIDSLPERPKIGAYTATATERVRNDIVRLLRLRNPVTSTTGFDRPNLFFEVCQPKSKMEGLRTILRKKRDESGIIYCATRKAVEQVAEELQEDGYSVGRYHAGLADEERKQAQEDFQYDRVSVMVATNAFGMGIDKSNVSYVIHYNMPRSMEAYYQEAGRAGRDGSPAECILLYSGQDIITGRWLIEHSEPNQELTEQEQKQIRIQDLHRLNQMADYCTKASCLRSCILRYFGQKSPDSCGACSRCVSGHYAEINGMERVKITAADRRAAALSPKAGQSLAEMGTKPKDGLIDALKAVRSRLAKACGTAPFIIASDKTLFDMAAKKPRTPEQMLDVNGMGDIKVSRFGSEFLQAIADWQQAHGGATNETHIAPGTSTPAGRSAPRRSAPRPHDKNPNGWKKDDIERLRREYLAGVTVEQMAAIHCVGTDEINGQLKRLGLLFDASQIEQYGIAAYYPEDGDEEP